MSQTLTLSTVFGAAGTNSNILSGQRIADLPATFGQRFRVTYCSNMSAAGATEQVYVGNNKQPVQDSSVAVVATAGRLVTRDDVVSTFEANAGEKIVVQVTAAGAHTHLCRIIVTPIA